MSGDTIHGNPPKRNWVSFWSLLVLQTQNAFNDKAAQFLLIPLGGVLMASFTGAGSLEYILGALIVLPFIFFAPLSGWLSDRFSKTYVIRGAIYLQFAVFVMITFAIWQQNLWLAVAGFFLLSVESVILSPAKRGIVKELVGHERLGFASGILEMSVILAVCAGQILSSWWFDLRLTDLEALRPGDMMNGWDSALTPLVIVAAAAVPTIGISYGIQKIPAMGNRPFEMRLLWEHFGQLQELWVDRRIRLCAAGAAFFWGFAGFLNLAAIQIGKDTSGGGVGFGSDIAWLMLAASGGITLGGVVASLVCRRKIELGLVPIGGGVMVIGSLALALTPITSVWIKIWIAFAGAGGAILLVPLNAHLQDLCPPDKRGKIIAGLNLLDCLAGLLAVVLQATFAKTGAPYWIQFLTLAGIAYVATSYAARILPQHFIRLLVLGAFKVFYRIKVLHADRVPKEGGVLLTPNHMSYIDAFILSAACPRKIRFLMFDEYFRHPWIGPFVRVFDTVPISNKRAKAALRVAAEALQEGAVVCIFPEGQLARTGVMNEFKRGFEMIARKADCPVLPAAMDGLWGSIFSFERNQFLYKWPYRIPYGVTVSFGNPVPAQEADAAKVRRTVESLRAEAFSMRLSITQPLSVLRKNVRVLHGDAGLYGQALARIIALPVEEQSRIVANALQVGEINAIRRRQTVMIEWDALLHCRDVLAVAFVQFYDLKVVLVDSETSAKEIKRLGAKYRVEQYFSGKNLVASWRESGLTGGCYDFSGSEMVHEGVYACYTQAGKIISMSMPHPAARTATNLHQDGWIMGAWGRLLPGFDGRTEHGKILLSGVSLGERDLVIRDKELNADAIVGSSTNQS